MDPITLSAIISGVTSTLGMAEKNKAKAVKTGGKQGLLSNRPVISLAPSSEHGMRNSLMNITPVGYQVLGSSANNIQPAYLKKVGGGGGGSLNMNQMNLARMGGDPELDKPIKDYDPLASGKPSTEAGAPVGLADPSTIFEPPTNPQRLPKTEDEMKHEVELQKMSDKNAMIRQGISSAGSFLGTMMRPPPAVTVGGYRQNIPLRMFPRRRGLMGG